VLSVLDAPLAEDFFSRLGAAISGPPSSGLGYSLSKMAINRMVRRRALCWGRRGVRILSLSPGLIDTVMGAIEDAQGSKDSKAALRSRLPLARDGTMAEIADAVEFLASRRASYITGTDLLVDGGLAAAMRFPEPRVPAACQPGRRS
jgi:NAD(P)-dependent dehydrogenase (short-subunit alcohol dehydrogenase family)